MATKEESEPEANRVRANMDRPNALGQPVDHTKARQRIRDALASGHLPKDCDVTCFTVGCPPRGDTCAACGELFSEDEKDAIAHSRSEQEYWFHRDCEDIWQQERHAP